MTGNTNLQLNSSQMERLVQAFEKACGAKAEEAKATTTLVEQQTEVYGVVKKLCVTSKDMAIELLDPQIETMKKQPNMDDDDKLLLGIFIKGVELLKSL